MVKLLIPTRNRPASLGGVLGFLSQFYPGTNIFVADGSEPSYEDQYQEVISQAKQNLNITYKRYSAEVPFVTRVLSVLEELDDDCISIGADDDYPLMEKMDEGEQFLLANPDYVSVVPASIVFSLRKAGKLRARLRLVEDIDADEVQDRVLKYAELRFATTYATTRREHLIARYQRFEEAFVPGFYDYSVGLHDSVMGKVKCLDGFGVFATRNHNHSYVRRNRDIWLLDMSAQIDRLREFLVRDLIASGQSDNEANALATKIYSMHLAQYLTPYLDEKVRKATTRFEPTATQRQIYGRYHDLFTQGTDMNSAFSERLRVIVDQLIASTVSGDNAGEPSKYFSIQMDKT